jgi:hypothetical protein
MQQNGRKLPMLATSVFFSAVVQNSRKWKAERAKRKKGTRQAGLDVKNRTATMAIALDARAIPRQKALRAMPESDLGWPAK